MKYFSHLTDAIFYRTNCPICKKGLKHQNISDLSFIGEKIILKIDTSIGDAICIDIKDDIITAISMTRDSVDINEGTTYKYSAFASTDYSIYNNMLSSFITISCNECEQFLYRVQIQINLTNLKITNIFLESEFVSIVEDSTVYEIENIYEKQETHYSAIYSDSNDKFFSIPLIPLNLDNPHETLNRIKKLLVFS